MVTTLCISSAAVLKAGANAPSLATDAEYTQLINQAEGLILASSRYNWIDAYAGLNIDTKYFIEGICSDLVGIQLIKYDMSGYTSRIEAEDMINVLRDSALRGLMILKDKEVQKFITDTSTGTV